VKELAQKNHAVIVNYFQSETEARAVVSEIRSNGGHALALRGNVGNREDREALIEQTIQHFGRLDVLVNNAGITSQGRKDLLEATEESWDLVFDTNLKGPFFLAQLAANRMIELQAEEKVGTCYIVNVSSISAYATSTNRADYCMAKSAMQMMTWLLATRLADENIRVYEICPGVIASDMTQPVKEKYDQLIEDGLSPIRRWGEAEDVARAVSTMVSGVFPFSTGDRINVDGGFHIRRL
jgi:NAD(P)-dependent dehydrogenase (short-subunit alcohol dehydrogenase family)